ncbi:hypothetical protein [Chrysanthemum yellows phytoplasma]|uniref:hypothetical protein n=1 Tax=Chrysanthemum yellows phytoplasma TaxID=238674 RepID=UPI000AD006EE|nr:hypothetical protein [Chrysanthemum yellows phytoplasma]
MLLFLLGLRLPKLFKSIQDKNKLETQSQYQTQYIHDTNKVQNIIGLINSLKCLKTLKQLKEPKKQKQQLKPQTEKQEQEQEQYQFDWNSNYDTDDNKLVKDIAVVTLTTGAVVISCLVLTPIFASLGPIAAPIALLA